MNTLLKKAGIEEPKKEDELSIEQGDEESQVVLHLFPFCCFVFGL